MTLPAEIVLASGNAGKLREFEQLFADWSVAVRPQSHFAVTPPEETGVTFVENALIKARAAAAATGMAALADDSGICVDALQGAPGVRSARFAGTHGDDAANNARLLELLAGVPPDRRQAAFHCVLVLLRHADDPVPLIATGRWDGRIATTAHGGGGFGYDPLFVDAASGRHAAELDAATKNRLSHRGRAAARLREQLQRSA